MDFGEAFLGLLGTYLLLVGPPLTPFGCLPPSLGPKGLKIWRSQSFPTGGALFFPFSHIKASTRGSSFPTLLLVKIWPPYGAPGGNPLLLSPLKTGAVEFLGPLAICLSVCSYPSLPGTPWLCPIGPPRGVLAVVKDPAGGL